jgi:hypothetical protein
VFFLKVKEKYVSISRVIFFKKTIKILLNFDSIYYEKDFFIYKRSKMEKKFLFNIMLKKKS